MSYVTVTHTIKVSIDVEVDNIPCNVLSAHSDTESAAVTFVKDNIADFSENAHVEENWTGDVYFEDFSEIAD